MKTMTRRLFACRIAASALLTAALLPITSAASNQIPAKPQDHPIAIVGATIHPVSGPAIEKGTILFDAGKIVALGTNVPLPKNAEVIDAAGKHVYPGLISPNTQIGLNEIDAVRASLDETETGSMNPNVRAEVAVNPESELIPVVRSNGITMVVSTPTGGLISGTSAMMMMDGWTCEDMTLQAPLALNLNWPEMTVNKAPWVRKSEEEQKKEHETAVRQIEDAFRDARAYMKAKAADGEKGIPHQNADLRWESMIPVLQRKVPVVIWADEVQQIEAAVAWAEQESLRVIIGGGHDAWRVAELLRRHDIPVLAGGIYRLPDRRFEEYDEPYMLPAKLLQAGVRFAIISEDEPAHERNLPYHAGTAAAYGLPPDEAIKAITLSPAQIFGVADRVGSLETGKDATLIVTTGSPLDIRSNVLMEFIRGRRIDLSNKQTMLYEKYKEKYRRLRP